MPDTVTELYRRINSLERQVGSLNRKAKASGWQLVSSFDMHRHGGGRLMWQFDGQSVHVGSYNTIWAETNILQENYESCEVGGGPYVRLNGTDEYLTIADAAWQETGGEEFLVWAWVYATSAQDGTIVSKWDANAGNLRSWRLLWDATPSLSLIVNQTGVGGAGVSVTSSETLVAETWYFCAGYYEPNSVMNVYVGANTDAALTKDTLAVGIPASTFDGAAALSIGVMTAAAGLDNYWAGEIGIVQGRANVPVGDIDEHVNMLFQSTLPFYTEEHNDALLLESSFVLMENWQKILLE
jgi:hypothetical protein